MKLVEGGGLGGWEKHQKVEGRGLGGCQKYQTYTREVGASVRTVSRRWLLAAVVAVVAVVALEGFQ